MRILLQLGIVFGLYWIGEGIEALLPIPFPASVISLLLLLILLLLGVVKEPHIREKADFLLGNLGFFFLPVSASLVNYVDIVWENAVPFFTICVVSTLLTYGVTVGVVRLVSRLQQKGRDKV